MICKKKYLKTIDFCKSVPMNLLFKWSISQSVVFKQYRFSSSSTRNGHNLKKLLFAMPRDHVAEAQKQRIRIKEKSSRYIPGIVNIQILGSGAPGSPATVYLFTDQSRYLFNCGEGTQRLAHEHKTKLTRLEHIFMTRTSWKRIGGLPGLSLTVQDAGVPNLYLHGPPGLGDIFRAMRRFVILKDLQVAAPVCENGESYEDTVLSVKYIRIFKNTESSSSNNNESNRNNVPELIADDDTDYYAHEKDQNDDRHIRSSPVEDNSNAFGHNEESSVMAYICKIKPRPGALCLEKCVDKGVPPGPLLGELKNGNNICLPNGTTVYANEVRAPDDPGPIFIVLDIPTIEYLDYLKENNHLFEEYQSSEEDKQATLVLHFTPQNILQHPAYQEFVKKFPAQTKHIILNGENKFSGYFATHRIQSQLNQLNENIFPLLKEFTDSSKCENYVANKKCKLDKESKELVDNAESNLFENASSLTCYHLRPFKGLDRSIEPQVSRDDYIKESTIIPGFMDSLTDLKTQLLQSYQNHSVNREADYPKIVFLGTGSCIPNKTRNVSSILVHTSPTACILLDCGEGTTGQIIRFYGQDKAKDIFQNLKAIYISHLHADHHIGLIGILQERRKYISFETPAVLLLAPRQITSWLRFYDNRIESIQNEYNLIENSNLLDNPLSDNEIIKSMGINSIETCLVRHCPHSFGIAINLDVNSMLTSATEPYKLTYSGDTMPCDALVKLGVNSTVLIHEATMEDELFEQAKYKMHSTVSQALEQGSKMNAKYILLTHFSQRYAKLPRIENQISNNVGIAFDNMEVTSIDLKYLHLLYPTLKLLFTEHCVEMEHKATKRAFKKKRMDLLNV